MAAVVTLVYNYGEQVAEIRPLEEEHEPGHYDLCTNHAAHLSVPTGWRIVRAANIRPLSGAPAKTALAVLADEVRSIGLRDEQMPQRLVQDNSSVIELRRLGHLRVLADVSRAS